MQLDILQNIVSRIAVTHDISRTADWKIPRLYELGGANEDDVLAAKAKYHALSDEYVQFSKAMNLPQQRERISIDGRKGVDVSLESLLKIRQEVV